MSIQTPRRIDRRTAEHLLGAAPMGTPDGHPPLAALLTAAAAPGRPDELAREQASVAAFRLAQLAPAPRPRSLSAVKTAVMKVLTVKAAVALAATTAGGVALAAGTGTLPNPLVPRSPAASSGLSAAHPTSTQSLAADSVNSAAPRGSKRPDSSRPPSPSPSLVGLCHTYFTGKKDTYDTNAHDKAANGWNTNDWNKAQPDRNKNDKAKNDKALDNPAFTALITAAGGKDKVDRFCLSLLAIPTPTNTAAQHGQKPDGGQHGGQQGGNHDDQTDSTGNPINAKPNASPDR